MRDRSLEPILEVKAWSKSPAGIDETRERLGDMACVVCGKAVTWGVDGCPIVYKGQEMLVLSGGWEFVKHYACEIPKESSLK